MEIYPFPATWRLLICDPYPGDLNMALDSAVLEAVGRGEVPPTLRLYRWDPPCLSLGYSQPGEDADLARLEEKGWDLVRRPTGGRAILHTDELTYAVIGPWSEPRLQGSLMDSYQRISRALFLALTDLGLPVEVHHGKNPLANDQPVCFENPSDFEITVEGKKIIGSAQARKKEGLLQHGSLPLTGDLTRITQVLAYPSDQARQQAAQELLQKAETASHVLGREISWEEAAQAFLDAFQTALNLELIPGQFTPAEWEAAKRLVESRFGSRSYILGEHLRREG